MAKAYCGSRISEHIIRDNAGFLICTAPVARSGWQEYRYSEINPASNDDAVVRVYRPPSEVTSPATIASGEGKPVVGVGHPARFITPESWSWAAKGHMQNIRVGPRDANGDVTLIADLHIQDGLLIDRIASGVRDLSCGYMYDVEEQPDGTYTMKNIRMNHVAVVPEGRAKTTYIVDGRPAMTDEERNAKLEHLLDLLETFVAQRTASIDAPRRRTRMVADARRKEASDFEVMARRCHRRDFHIRSDREGLFDELPESATRAAHDAAVLAEEDPNRAYEKAMREAGARMREQKDRR